jgi:threonine synthase
MSVCPKTTEYSMITDGIWRFADRLPSVKEECKLTLGEGNTPLIRLTGTKFYAKVEGMNPTSSFKDRGIAYLTSKIVEEGVDRVVIDSSGNAAVSTSAYCTKAGIKLIAVMPAYSHVEKKTQVLWHGAEVVEVLDRETARIYARRISKELGLRYVGVALEPAAVPGFQTTSYEVAERLAPDAVFVPTGSGTNLVAIGKGYKDLEEGGEVNGVPEIHCVQSAACAPISGEFTNYTPIKSTLAEGVIVPVTERKDEAVKTVRSTGGNGWVVDDEEVYRSLELLSRNGIYSSPTGAVGLAGAIKANYRGSAVCIVTDSGLKSNLMLDSFRQRITQVSDERELDDLIEKIK